MKDDRCGCFFVAFTGELCFPPSGSECLPLGAALCYHFLMRVLGITAEYNPLHNGHIYHLRRSAEETGADCTVVVMSGYFTQRGEAAILDKWTRSRLAVEHGADLVLELPFVFACARGSVFAAGAVDILKGMGVTDISFGSETGDSEMLESLVDDLRAKGREIDELTRRRMRDGDSYARSYRAAAGSVLGEERASLMDTPNNILAIEYMKRIAHWRDAGYATDVHAVKRFGSGYDDVNDEAGFAGASAIRRVVSSEGAGSVAAYVPDDVERELVKAEDPAEAERRAFLLLQNALVTRDGRELSDIYCMGEGLENKLKREIVRAGSMKELISSVVSRRYTEAAVRRLLVYILMDMRVYDPPSKIYGRVLAAGEKGRKLLRRMADDDGDHIPIITSVNSQRDVCAQVEDTLKYDMMAADVYNILKGRDLYEFSDRVQRPYMR